jgi:hypothetical protein
MKLATIQTNTLRPSLTRVALITGFSLAISAKATIPTSDLPNFDGLPNFAQLGNQITEHNATVNGNVGVSSGGLLDLDNPGTINGNVFVSSGATFDQVGTVNGSVFTGQDLSTDQSAVFSASAGLGALPAVQTVSGDQTSSLSYNVPVGQVEVVDLNGGLDLKHTDDITLTGGGDLVLNISGSFTLQDSASILGNPANIFINYLGTSAVTSDENNLVDGQIFFPNAEAELKSTFFGAIYSGDQNVELLANGTLNAVALPEPGSTILISTALTALLLARNRLCRPKHLLRKKN